MKHFLLKFNAGVEIGARLAYEGHHARTKSGKIYLIIGDEKFHRRELINILSLLDDSTNPFIDWSFYLIGNTIKFLCKFMPLWSLDFVARVMELFAISNYEKLGKVYPQYKWTFDKMAAAEKDHEEYFRIGEVRYTNLNNLRNSIGVGKL